MTPRHKQTKRVTVRLINIHTGDYRVSSAHGQDWYTVNVARPTCTCKAGEMDFRGCKELPWCKHVAAAKIVAKALHDRQVARRAAAQEAPVAAPIDLARYRGAEGLLEACGA